VSPRYAATLLLVAALLGACTRAADSNAPDDTRGIATRIVTLAPHLAELVHVAGAGDQLVGVSAFSNYPEAVTKLPLIGDAFMIDQERLALLEPDLLLAWESGTPLHTIDELRSRGYRVEVIPTRGLADVGRALQRIGELTGHEPEAAAAARRFAAELDALRARHSAHEPVSVFYQISVQPLYTVNATHYVSELIELCGGTNIFADLDELAPLVGEEAVLARNPEALLAGSAEMDGTSFDVWARWPGLAANARGNHFEIPADLLARPTPRLLGAGVAICAALDAARERRGEVSRK
jgi:iron complex transport system substrate-binding protein